MSDDRDIAGEDEDRFLVAEYALGLLGTIEQDQLRARLRTDPALRADFSFWRSQLSSLDVEFAETAAPAGILPKVERRIFPTNATANSGFWNSLSLWRSLAGAAAAVAVIAVGVNIVTPRPDPNAFAAQLVAALNAEGSNVSVVALYNADTGKLRLTGLSGDAVPGKDYELWAIEGSEPAKSMGVIPVNARTDVKIAPDILVQFGAGTTLAITLEQKGGSPTGKAQGPIVAAGKATPV